VEFSLLSFKLGGNRRSSSGDSSLRSPRQWLLDAIGSLYSTSGKKVTPEKALTLSAVWRAVSLISETVGSLSFEVVRRLENGGRVVETDHQLYPLVHTQVNSWLSSQMFRQTMQMIALLYGNAVAIIHRDKDGFPQSFEILKPGSFKIFLNEGNKWFKLVGKDMPIADADVIHIMGQSLNGYEGLSAIQYHARTLSLGMVTKDYQEKFYRNGAHVKGALKFAGQLKEGRPAELSEEWDKNWGGENSFKTPVLHSGAEYERFSLPQRDAQTIELMGWNVEDIARVYGLTLDRLSSEKKTSYNSIEQNNMRFIQDCIRPKAKIWEAEYERKVLYGDSSLKAALDLNSLLRGDIKTRINYYRSLWYMGGINVNEIRSKENMNPRDGGDEYFNPTNMQSESMAVIMEKLAELELEMKKDEA